MPRLSKAIDPVLGGETRNDRIPAPAAVAEPLDQQQRRALPGRFPRDLHEASSCTAGLRRIRSRRTPTWPIRVSPPGTKNTTRMNSTPRMKSGCCSGVRKIGGQRRDGVRRREIAEPVVGEGVEDAADHRAPARAGAAEHDHQQQRQREARGRHLRVRSSEQQQVDDPACGREHRREHEGHQLVGVRLQPEHLDAQLVLADRLPDMAGRRVDGPADDREHGRSVSERQPVQILRVEDADRPRRQLVVVDAEPLLASGPPVGILQHQDRAGLGERQRHHGEGDAADPQRDRAEHDREHEPDERREEDRLPEAPVPPGHRDRRDVDADGEVERVPERQEPREPEQQVVAQREPAEQQAERQQLERARRVQAAAEQVGDVDRELRHEGQDDDDRDRDRDPLHAKLREKPPGRTIRMIPSSSTTLRSPSPEDA